MTMVDIGKVEKLVCVKTAAEEGTSVLEAQGTKGAVRFVLFPQAYSRHRFVLHGFGHSSRVEVFDVRLLAFLNSLYCIDKDNLKLSFERLNRGDEIKLPHYDEAWEILLKHSGPLYAPKGYIEWIDVTGRIVEEPPEFRRERILLDILSIRNDARTGIGQDSLSSRLLDFIDANFIKPSKEFDFLVDWYERLAAVARSINQRQDDGRSGCSERKFAEVKDFYDKSQVQIDKLNSDGIKYSLYLSSRMKQILEMHNSGKWAKMEKIEAFRSRFL